MCVYIYIYIYMCTWSLLIIMLWASIPGPMYYQ